MLHTEVDEDCSLVCLDGVAVGWKLGGTGESKPRDGLMEFANSVHFVWVYEFERGVAIEFVRFVSCSRLDRVGEGSE